MVGQVDFLEMRENVSNIGNISKLDLSPIIIQRTCINSYTGYYKIRRAGSWIGKYLIGNC